MGPVDDIGDCRSTPGTWVRGRGDQHQHVPGRRLPARQRLPPRPGVRRKAIGHLLGASTSWTPPAPDLKLWFSDGTNYPGQDDLDRQDRLTEALAAVYARLGDGQRLLLEYKLFEPAFYVTDVPDWGTAYSHCLRLGDKARVVVDTGHHAADTNIEFIVAFLLREGKLGGFGFNSRFYADDDLMVGAADPFQLFRIMYEVIRGGGLDHEAGGTSCSTSATTSSPRSPARSGRDQRPGSRPRRRCWSTPGHWPAAQPAGRARRKRVLMDAYNTDVRPLLAGYERKGLDPDPMGRLRPLGHAEKIVAERVGGRQAGWGA